MVFETNKSFLLNLFFRKVRSSRTLIFSSFHSIDGIWLPKYGSIVIWNGNILIPFKISSLQICCISIFIATRSVQVKYLATFEWLCDFVRPIYCVCRRIIFFSFESIYLIEFLLTVDKRKHLHIDDNLIIYERVLSQELRPLKCLLKLINNITLVFLLIFL